MQRLTDYFFVYFFGFYFFLTKILNTNCIVFVGCLRGSSILLLRMVSELSEANCYPSGRGVFPLSQEGRLVTFPWHNLTTQAS